MFFKRPNKNRKFGLSGMIGYFFGLALIMSIPMGFFESSMGMTRGESLYATLALGVFLAILIKKKEKKEKELEKQKLKEEFFEYMKNQK